MIKHTTQRQDAPFYTRASVDKNTIVDTDNERSFWVVAATDTPVFRRSWEENFNEILEVEKGKLRTERLDEGAVPLLNNHWQYGGADDQLGTVAEYRIEKGQLLARVLFSVDPKHDGLWKNIKAGIVRSISAGYRVYKYLREVVGEGLTPNYRAQDWEVMEVSLAPVPADPKSKVGKRDGYEPNEVIIENFSNVQNTRTNMEGQTTEAVVEQTPATTTPTNQARSNEAPATPVTVQAVDENQIRSQAAQAERQRGIDIRFAVRAAKLDDAFADKLIAEGTSVDQARKLILDKMAETDTTPAVRSAQAPTQITVNGDEKVNTRNAMVDAMLHRAQPGSVTLEGKAHDFKYMSMLDMARHSLMLAGDKGIYSPSETVKRAIATSDYPLFLTSTVERSIRRTYDALPAEWKLIAQQTTAKDFREKTGIAIDGKTTFEEVSEGGEYKQSLILQDDSAKLKLKTYGRMIKITRQAIINDDLSVFDKLPKLLAQGAANFQAAKVWGLILGNAKTPDGKTLFHADHKNQGAAGVISKTTLSEARTKMWRQTTPVGEPMPIAGKYLIVPMELMTEAEAIMTAISSNTVGEVNTFANKFTIMTSPYLIDPKAWYVAADPKQYEGATYAYLEGEEGLFIDKEVNFNDDSVATKARLDFDCAMWDYRAWFKNAGQ